MYTPLAGAFITESDPSMYTSLIRNQPHEETGEPNEVQKKKLGRDQSYEEIKDYEEISDEEVRDEQLYAEPKDVRPYEKPILRKEKSYEDPDDATDQPLSSPIYIVPDPEEQKKMEYQHFTTQSTVINGEHNVSIEYRYMLKMYFIIVDVVMTYEAPNHVTVIMMGMQC